VDDVGAKRVTGSGEGATGVGACNGGDALGAALWCEEEWRLC
jgi:hypothetical protein